MKRLTPLLLVVVLSVCLCACGSQKEKIQKPVNFYYVTRPENLKAGSNILTPEARESAGYEDLLSLLNEYVRGPLSDNVSSPFPAGSRIDALTVNGTLADVTLSSAFSKLTGVDLTLACAGLSMTIFELSDVQQVMFSVTDALLDGHAAITLSRDDLIIYDDSMVQNKIQ